MTPTQPLSREEAQAIWDEVRDANKLCPYCRRTLPTDHALDCACGWPTTCKPETPEQARARAQWQASEHTAAMFDWMVSGGPLEGRMP